MATNTSLEAVLKAVGHDGSEILWPQFPEPQRRKGFHVEEIQYAAYTLGFFLVPYTVGLMYGPRGIDPIIIDLTKNYKEVMLKHNGILVGHYHKSPNNHHAVAWDCTEGRVYDPEGYVHSNPESFAAEAFYAAVKRST